MRFRFVAGLLAPALLGAACGPTDSRTVLLRFKAKPGDEYKVQYQTTTKLDMVAGGKVRDSGQHSTITVLRSFTCKSVEGTSTTWEAKTLDANAEGEGDLAMQGMISADTESRRKPFMFTRDERNQVVGEEKSSPVECEFPTTEVRVGDAWRSEVKQSGIKLVMLYTLEKFEKVDGRDAVLIKGDIEDGRTISLTRPARSWFDVETGQLIRGECEFMLDQRSDTRLTISMSVTRQ